MYYKILCFTDYLYKAFMHFFNVSVFCFGIIIKKMGGGGGG